MTLRADLSTPLRGFDLDLALRAAPGRPVALVGRSGAGKTSVLRVIAGLLSPHRGTIELAGRTWLDTERRLNLDAERRDCGLLFQDHALFPRMSAWRNVAYGMRRPRRERRAAAVALLERFEAGALVDARPANLSGGERQRVALARALAAEPRALLLDEPLAALDSSTRPRALLELRNVLAELAVPVLLVTHSFEEAAMLAEDVIVLERGRVAQRGTAAEISLRPASPFVADFSGAVVLRGEATRGGDGLTLIRLEGGGILHSVDRARGPVVASVFPWEISLELGRAGEGSMRNRLAGEVVAVTTIGNRARVGVIVPQPLTAEISANSAKRLALKPGTHVTAAWKASVTRLLPDAERPAAPGRPSAEA